MTNFTVLSDKEVKDLIAKNNKYEKALEDIVKYYKAMGVNVTITSPVPYMIAARALE